MTEGVNHTGASDITLAWKVAVSIFVFAVMLATAGFVLMLDSIFPKPLPAFSDGQRVVSALDGRMGMVSSSWCPSGTDRCQYNVRFVAEQVTTDTRLVGSDGPMQSVPYALARMEEFELRAAAN